MRTQQLFLWMVFVTVISLGLAVQPAHAQLPKAPNPAAAQGSDPDAPQPPPNMDRKLLEENDKDMKKKVQQLYDLVSQLKEQVDKTDSSKVLNLELVKKAEEIEKLAHDIKNRTKG
jgi:peptidoglycan hydrolase CwlO-like protein